LVHDSSTALRLNLAPVARRAVKQISNDAQQIQKFVRLYAQAQAEGPSAIAKVSARFTPAFEAIQVSVPSLLVTATNAETVVGRNGAEQAKNAYSTARTVVIALMLLGIVLSIALARLTARSVTRPLAETVEVLEAVAEGDLTRRSRITSEDELGKMANSLNRAVDAQQAAAQLVESTSRSQRESSADNAAVIALLRELAGGTTRKEVIAQAIDSVRSHFGWSYACYWEIDASGAHVVASSGHAGSSGIDRSPAIQHGSGLAGRAWSTRELVASDEGEPMSDCPRVTAARQSGLPAAVAVPIVIGGNVEGLIEVFAAPDQPILASWRRWRSYQLRRAATSPLTCRCPATIRSVG
jgi:HAMP domain-containing protein